MKFDTLVQSVLKEGMGWMSSDDFESEVLKDYVGARDQRIFVVRVYPQKHTVIDKKDKNKMWADIEVSQIEQETGYMTPQGNYSFKDMVGSHLIGDDFQVAWRWWNIAAKGILKTIEDYKAINDLDDETKEDWKDILPNL